MQEGRAASTYSRLGKNEPRFLASGEGAPWDFFQHSGPGQRVCAAVTDGRPGSQG